MWSASRRGCSCPSVSRPSRPRWTRRKIDNIHRRQDCLLGKGQNLEPESFRPIPASHPQPSFMATPLSPHRQGPSHTPLVSQEQNRHNSGICFRRFGARSKQSTHIKALAILETLQMPGIPQAHLPHSRSLTPNPHVPHGSSLAWPTSELQQAQPTLLSLKIQDLASDSLSTAPISCLHHCKSPPVVSLPLLVLSLLARGTLLKPKSGHLLPQNKSQHPSMAHKAQPDLALLPL